MKSIPLVCLSTAAPAANPRSKGTSRKFRFIEYGKAISSKELGGPTISCDGRIAGVSLELTHWNGNETPETYYADTSTEMALKLPPDIFEDATVVNNHFDTDGVLSVFACLHPDIAQEDSDLLVEGAAAGDFGEWISDRGIQLDATLEAICQLDCKGDDALAYERTIKEMPDILNDIAHNEGAAYESLWKPALDDAYKSMESLQKGESTMERTESGLILSIEATGETKNNSKNPQWLSSFALHRGLVERGWWESAN